MAIVEPDVIEKAFLGFFEKAVAATARLFLENPWQFHGDTGISHVLYHHILSEHNRSEKPSDLFHVGPTGIRTLRFQSEHYTRLLYRKKGKRDSPGKMDFALLDPRSIQEDGRVNRNEPVLIGVEVGLNKTLARMGDMDAGPAARSVRPGDAAKLIREIKYREMRHGFLLEFYRKPGRAGDAKSVFDDVVARDVTGLHVLSVVAGCGDRPAMVSVFPRDWRQRLELGDYPEIEADPWGPTDSDRTRLERFICRCGKVNALLQTELARQLKELSEPPHLKYGKGESFKSMTLRRQPGQPPLARISSGDDPPEELREIDRSLAISLVREGLALDERGHLTIPSSENQEFVARVLRAIRSTLGVGRVSTDAAPPEVESPLLDFLIEKAGSIEGPEDWSTEHDHYLYGTPKRNEGDRE